MIYLSLITFGIASSDYFSFIKVNLYSYYFCSSLAVRGRRRLTCQSPVILAKLLGNKTKTPSVGGGLSCPYINPSLLPCKRTTSHKLSGLLSKINGTEQTSDFGSFGMI